MINFAIESNVFLFKEVIDMSIAFKNRTRNEVIAAFRESIRKKNECMQRMSELMQEIRREEQAQPTI